MTIDHLIDEGRRLQRRTVLLDAGPSGEFAGMWYGPEFDKGMGDGERRWIAVDARFIPSFEERGWLSVWTKDRARDGGRVELSDRPPVVPGRRLYAREVSVLPPIDAVFARGLEAVGDWLEKAGWGREWGYNSNFKDRSLVERYIAIEQRENPIFRDDVYAVLGGWHMPWPDDDWIDLIDEKRLVQTVMDAEPWVEAWQMRSGEFKIIQRIT